MSLVGARVRDVCYCHWPVDPDVLETRLPRALSVATREGAGWVTLIGQRTRPTAGPVPLPGEYAQVTVRTYVHAGNGPAVHIFRVDADSRLVARAARTLFGVPFRCVDASVTAAADGVQVRTTAPGGRPLFDGTFDRSDATEPVDGDSLLGWLTDRSTFALADGRTGTVDHGPWRVAAVDAEVRTDDLLASEGLAAAGDPLRAYSPGTSFVLRSWPSRSDRSSDSA